ncbi:unnamed protein product [Hermetia illucens]|uniref:Reverse transcriptase domain-containing protein n=1 Tax=Hermetia illucens TaxID=343691 RepID=A0A7R8V3P3_HERIL|nr:unnamed protein product [Hermetia illucens]
MTLEGFAIKYVLSAKCELTYLMYLDDIKLYAATNDHLRSLLRIVGMFSRDIRMELALDRRILAIHKGHHEPHAEHIISDLHIQAMTGTDFYKYLGILQGIHARVNDLKDALLSEFLRRVKPALKSHLSGKNRISALNIFAIPSLAYAFGILQWTKIVQRRIRTTMSKFQMHHPNSALEQMNLPPDILISKLRVCLTWRHNIIAKLTRCGLILTGKSRRVPYMWLSVRQTVD